MATELTNNVIKITGIKTNVSRDPPGSKWHARFPKEPIKAMSDQE